MACWLNSIEMALFFGRWGFLVRCSLLSLFDERQVGCEIKQIDLFLSSLGISHLTTIQSSGWRREDSDDDDDDGQSFSPANSSWISSLMEIPSEEKFNFSWICRRFCFSSKKTDKWRWMSPMKWRRRRRGEEDAKWLQCLLLRTVLVLLSRQTEQSQERTKKIAKNLPHCLLFSVS